MDKELLASKKVDEEDDFDEDFDEEIDDLELDETT